MKITRLLAMMALPLLTLNIAAADEVVITGNVGAIPDSTLVTLYRSEGQMGVSIASDTIRDGKFRLTFPADSGLTKTELDLYKDGHASNMRILYIRPNANVEINATDPYVGSWNVRSNVPEQMEYDRFISKSKDILDMLQKNNDFTRTILGSSDNNTISDVEVVKFDESLLDSLKVVVMLRDIELLGQMPVTTVWLEKFEELSRRYTFFDEYSDSLRNNLLNLYNKLDDSDKGTKQGMIANALLNPTSKLNCGEMVPEVTFFDVDGNRHSLSEFKGKLILLDFWSSGCYPCIMALPELQELKEKYADVLAVVSLSIDNDKMWKEATERFGLSLKGNNWNEGKEDVGIYQKLGEGGIPTFVLVSPEGVIKAKWSGYGKGSLERQYKLYSRQKDKPEFTNVDGVRYVRQPEYENNQTSGILDVEQVEISDKGITLCFSVNYTPGWWISISPEAYLTAEDGTKLALRGSDGITPGEHFYADENGSGIFSLTFDILPEETHSVSFYEGPEGWWNIKNIYVK